MLTKWLIQSPTITNIAFDLHKIVPQLMDPGIFWREAEWSLVLADTPSVKALGGEGRERALGKIQRY